jgi:hypothetical protein
MPGTRVVVSPAFLEGMDWPPGAAAVRLAPDEVFVLGNLMAAFGTEPAIIEPEAGFVGWWLTPDELAAVAHHADWPLPEERPAVAQGLIAGVPTRLWLTGDRTLLVVQAAYAHELTERLP